MIMEYKVRANIVMGRELTIEAEDLVEALEKARAMMAEPIPQKELTPLRIFYDNIREDGKEVTVG
jgi:hypothetical protein